MIRTNKTLLLALLTGALALPTIAWAQTKTRPKPAPAKVEEPQEPYTEEEYDACFKATDEPDLDKRQAALIAFLEKWPQSKLKEHVVPAYKKLLYEYQQKQNYAKLIPAAEAWLKYEPDDLTTIAFIAEAAQKLGQDAKFLEYGQKLYAKNPSGDLSWWLSQSYKKTGDQAKYLIWVEKTLSDPKYKGRFDLHMEFVDKFTKEKNFAKAAEHAQMALTALEAAKKPDTTSESDWLKAVTAVKRACHYIIGVNYYDKDKYNEAVQSLERCISVDPRFDWAHYYIGLSLWKQGKLETNEALLSFAKAVRLNGEASGQAKEHLEKIYRAIHNGNLTGIEKVYNRADEELGPQRSAAKTR
jgi:tetratricopeptide (TPR) repeat protein